MSGDNISVIKLYRQVSRNNMSSVNITSMYMVSDRVIAKHNQAELSRLEA